MRRPLNANSETDDADDENEMPSSPKKMKSVTYTEVITTEQPALEEEEKIASVEETDEEEMPSSPKRTKSIEVSEKIVNETVNVETPEKKLETEEQMDMSPKTPEPIQVVKNDVFQFFIHEDDQGQKSYVNLSHAWTMVLQKDDTVQLKLRDSGKGLQCHSKMFVWFNGQLLSQM